MRGHLRHWPETRDEATVRRLAAVSVTERASPDLYFDAVAARLPVVGLAALDTLRMLHAAERNNDEALRKGTA